MNQYVIVRRVIELAVGLTTYSVTRSVIDNNTEESDSKVKKAGTALGSIVIAQMVSQKCTEYVNEELEKFQESYRKAKDEVSSAG